MSEAGKRISPNINEQCFLLEKANIIRHLPAGDITRGESAYAKKQKVVRQLGKWGAASDIGGYNTNIKYINKLTKAQNSKNFFEISAAEEAQLAHYAAIHIVTNPLKGKKRRKAVFTKSAFRDGIDKKIFKSRGQRSAAGIVSLDIIHEGIDSATEKVGLVNAKFIFQDIRTMLSQPYVELFKVGASEKTTKGTIFRTVEFELGWNASPDLATKLNLSRMKLKLKTHLVKYTFDLKQDGSIVVDAQYRGRIEDIFNGPNSNVLTLAKSKFQEVKNNINAAKEKASANATAAVKKAQAARDKAIATDLITKIMNQNAAGAIKIETGKGTRTLDPSTTTGGKKKWSEVLRTNILTEAGTWGHTSYAKQRITDASSGAFGIIKRLAKKQIAVQGFEGDKEALTREIDNQISEMMSLWQKKVIKSQSTTKLQAGLESKEVFNLTGDDRFFLDRIKWDPASRKMTIKEDLGVLQDALAKSKQKATETAAEATTDLATAIERANQELLMEAMLAKFTALQQIGSMLFNHNKIITGYIPKASAQAYRMAVGEKSTQGIKAAIEGVTTASFLAHRVLTEENLANEDYQVVPFMYLGRLIETILELPTDLDAGGNTTGTVYELIKQESGEKPTVDFGYVSFTTPFSGKKIHNFPLYYLPISLKKINNFFAREVVAKERQFFSFKDFLNALLKGFFTNMFNVCASDANNVVSFVSPKIQRLVGQGGNDVHYFIYGSKSIAHDIKNGKIKFGKYSGKNSNWANKIYHFFFGGQAKGSVLNVKVTDVADDAAKTAIYYSNRASAMAQGNLSRKSTLMPVVFQADIETIGFPLFNIGQLIYVDLRPYIRDKNNRLFKANGYYGIYKVAHSFSADSFTSKVSAIIQYSRAQKGLADKIPAGSPKTAPLIDTSAHQQQIKNIQASGAKMKEYVKTGKIDGEVPKALTAAQKKEETLKLMWKKRRQNYEEDPALKGNPTEAEGKFLFQQGPKAYTYAYGPYGEEAEAMLLEYLKEKAAPGKAQEALAAWKKQYKND